MTDNTLFVVSHFCGFLKMCAVSELRSGSVGESVMCCRMHRTVKFGEPAGAGCRGQMYGSHPAIKALYEGVVRNEVCLVEPHVKEKDRQLVDAALDVDYGGWSGQPGMEWLSRFHTSSLTEMSSFGAGYCYLLAFVPGVRSRVARVLGPLPYLTDVLRMLRVAGASDVGELCLVEVARGMFHVTVAAKGKMKGIIASWKFVGDVSNAIVRSAGFGRVGYDPFDKKENHQSCCSEGIAIACVDGDFIYGVTAGDHYAGSLVCMVCKRSLGVARVFCDLDKVGVFLVGLDGVPVIELTKKLMASSVVVARGHHGLDVYEFVMLVGAFEEEIMGMRRSVPWPGVESIIEHGAVGFLEVLFNMLVSAYSGRYNLKSFCIDCLFFVEKDGHASRCMRQGKGAILQQKNVGGWTPQRLKAWLGDVLLKLDIRMCLIAKGVESARLDRMVQNIESNEALAKYWKLVQEKKGVLCPEGQSVHALATTFEANYDGVVRKEFLKHHFC